MKSLEERIRDVLPGPVNTAPQGSDLREKHFQCGIGSVGSMGEDFFRYFFYWVGCVFKGHKLAGDRYHPLIKTGTVICTRCTRNWSWV